MRSLPAIVSNAKLSGAIWTAIEVARHGAGGRVPRVGEIGEQQGDALAGVVVEQPALETRGS